METLETHIFDGHVLRNDQIFEIQDLKKNIINFKSLTLPLDEMLDDLAVKFAHLVDEPSRFAFEDARDKVKKIMNRLENFREIMKLLTETNELIIARSTNATIRRLALFNCIIMCPSLIAGFFGMNIDI